MWRGKWSVTRGSKSSANDRPWVPVLVRAEKHKCCLVICYFYRGSRGSQEVGKGDGVPVRAHEGASDRLGLGRQQFVRHRSNPLNALRRYTSTKSNDFHTTTRGSLNFPYLSADALTALRDTILENGHCTSYIPRKSGTTAVLKVGINTLIDPGVLDGYKRATHDSSMYSDGGFILFLPKCVHTEALPFKL
ncbi:hypothetical protein ACMFMF_000871 [Clarireedia jacksonii]